MLAIKPKSFSIRVGDREVEIGSKAIEILRIVKMRGTLKAASEELGISYRGILITIRKLEKELGERLIETRRGRGARARLTRLGEEILDIYLSTKIEGMSFRNKIPARIVSIEREDMSAIVTVETAPSIVKALITGEALEELGLKVGDLVNLVIKASNIAIIK
ncbi:MAG: TOBE domain-containing protein [Sulfolobales archaeon]